VFLAGRSIRIQASTTTAAAACPACRRVSRRVHSRYERRLADTAVAGRKVVIQLRVRRSFCRDRAGCYSDGGSRGAPSAIQVADRWHLWHNLGDAAERAVARHRRCLHAAVAAAQVTPANGVLTGMPPAVPAGPVRRDRTEVRTRQRHAAIHQLLADGRSVRAIGLELGLARNTVRRFARTTDPEELLVHDGTGRRPSMLEAYEPYLRERWNSGTVEGHVNRIKML
jgi:hypothetical protein